MKMASAPDKNNSFDQKLTQCLVLIVQEQNRLFTEVERFHENVFGELQKIHESIDSINRNIQPVSRTKPKIVMKKEPLPNTPLLKSKPQEPDFIQLMKSLCLDVNRTTIAAVTSVAAQMSVNSLASRPPALNTILVIDTSESMQGHPFNTAQQFVNRMIDDIDTSAREFGLEEYISVITCGESVDIMQPFTNDFRQIRNTVDDLQVGGRTPLMTSLVLALCYLELQSECVRMADHVIMPRLIVVSDFDATLDKHPFTGRDEDVSADRLRVQKQLFGLGRTFKNQGYTVVCVPVGMSNDVVAKEFNATCAGQLVEPHNVQDIGCYFRNEAKKYTSVDGRRDTPDLSALYPSNILKDIGFEEESGLPSLGSRVSRGKDWNWQDQDSGKPGTVVGHKQKGMVYILWDNDKVGTYRYGYEGKSDIQKTNEPREVRPGEIEVGCCVFRGSDWERGDEDGGPGTVGIVVRKLKDGLVMVRWPSRVIETYCFGAGNKWELKVTLGKPQSHETNTPVNEFESAAEGSHSQTSKPTTENGGNIKFTQDLKPWWSWRDSLGQWRPFSQTSVGKIEEKFNISYLPQHCLVEYKNKPVKVFLSENKCEIDGERHEIKREMVSADEIESLIIMHEYL